MVRSEKKGDRLPAGALVIRGGDSDSIIMPKPIVEEEFYDLTKDDRSIQYEMNMIELPFFCRDDRLRENVTKVYYFSPDRQSYIKVVPSVSEDTGYKIPQDFDERIFYAIMVLHKRQGKKIVATIWELLSLAGVDSVSTKEYARAKEALNRLQGTRYLMQGVLYNKEQGTVEQKERKLNLIQQLVFYTTANAPEELQDYFNARRKEVVWIVLSDFLHEHIEARGFLWYDSQKLLEVSSATTRKLYLLLEKWRGAEHLMTVSRPSRFFASRIPLSWVKKNIAYTVAALEKSAGELQSRGMIGGWHLDKKAGLEKSELHFFFQEQTNSARLDVMRKLNAALAVKTGMEEREMYGIEDRQTTVFDMSAETVQIVHEGIEKILELLPEACTTDDWKRKLERWLKDKGEGYVISNIEYTVKRAPTSFAGFLHGALEGDWGAELRAEKLRDQKTAAIAAGKFTLDDVREWWTSLSRESKALVYCGFQEKVLFDFTRKHADLSTEEKNRWEDFKVAAYRSSGTGS